MVCNDHSLRERHMVCYVMITASQTGIRCAVMNHSLRQVEGMVCYDHSHRDRCNVLCVILSRLKIITDNGLKMASKSHAHTAHQGRDFQLS